ncbi:diguanylate cyclase domain-containing protein [Xanthomonas translucens]
MRDRAAPAGDDRAAADSASASPPGALTVSIGIATCPANAEAAIDLLQHADAALYRARRNCRNCCAPAQDAAAKMRGVAAPGRVRAATGAWKHRPIVPPSRFHSCMSILRCRSRPPGPGFPCCWPSPAPRKRWIRLRWSIRHCPRKAAMPTRSCRAAGRWSSSAAAI